MNISWFFGGKRAVCLALELVRWHDDELERRGIGTKVVRIGGCAGCLYSRSLLQVSRGRGRSILLTSAP